MKNPRRAAGDESDGSSGGDSSDGEDENGFNAGSKLVSAYLNAEHDTEQKKPVSTGPAATRMVKFTMFDGVNTMTAIEYELLSMIYDFSKSGLILALKPPITVRKGLFLLKKINCQVLYQAEPSAVPK